MSKELKPKPSVSSSCDTARVVSRKLRKAGFEMSKKIDRWSRSNGLIVRRLGCSKTVYVDYWNPAWMNNPTSEVIMAEVQFNKSKRDAAINYLTSEGYPIDSKGHIECQSSF